jgi:CRP-like cAMP-binding protein
MSDFVRQTIITANQQNNLHLSALSIEQILDCFEMAELQKGDFLLKEGQYCQRVILLERGLFMYYHIVDGEEVALDFAIEGDWISYIKSMSQGIPSDISIRAIEDSRVYLLPMDRMQDLFQKYPEFIQIRVNEIEKSFMEMAAYNIHLNTLTVEEHYKKLVETRKEWLSRVPQYYIASYLGIKPQSLSRIRKRISRNKK